MKTVLSVAALLCGVAAGLLAQADTTTPLHWAVYRDDVAEADKLLRGGAVVDAANREGVTALAMASLQGNTAMIEAC